MQQKCFWPNRRVSLSSPSLVGGMEPQKGNQLKEGFFPRRAGGGEIGGEFNLSLLTIGLFSLSLKSPGYHQEIKS